MNKIIKKKNRSTTYKIEAQEFNNKYCLYFYKNNKIIWYYSDFIEYKDENALENEMIYEIDHEIKYDLKYDIMKYYWKTLRYTLIEARDQVYLLDKKWINTIEDLENEYFRLYNK